MQCAAVCCNVLQCSVRFAVTSNFHVCEFRQMRQTRRLTPIQIKRDLHLATHKITLQHTATHCNTRPACSLANLSVQHIELFAYTYVSQVSSTWWLRLVGSLKLQVSFAKKTYKRDYILQKRPALLRSLPIVATPYSFFCIYVCIIGIFDSVYYILMYCRYYLFSCLLHVSCNSHHCVCCYVINTISLYHVDYDCFYYCTQQLCTLD